MVPLPEPYDLPLTVHRPGHYLPTLTELEDEASDVDSLRYVFFKRGKGLYTGVVVLHIFNTQ